MLHGGAGSCRLPHSHGLAGFGLVTGDAVLAQEPERAEDRREDT
jgi:hypothetical protein